MTDEKFIYRQDVREKSITARSARHKRTHNGKGGSVRLPSDNLSRKEQIAMNGEMKSYRLNEPMSWKEFKAMPDDTKILYIKALQKKFNIPATALGTMFGVNRQTVGKMLKDLKIDHRPQGSNTWDKEAFMRWLNGIKENQVEEAVATAAIDCDEAKTPVCDSPVCEEKTIPCSGCLTFDGPVEKALNTVSVLLGGANVRIRIAWELCDNG